MSGGRSAGRVGRGEAAPRSPERQRAAAQRKAPARSPRKTAPERPRRKTAPARKRSGILERFGLVGVLVAVLAVGGVVYGATRIDFGETIREITLPLRYENIIREQADDKGVPADLIAAVVNTESGFSDQTSGAGARGLMQITPDTADLIERLSGGETFNYDDLADPDLNIRYGTFFLGYLLDKYEGNEVAALAAYNAGPGNADAWGGAEMEREDIRFPETRSYVAKVLDDREDYQEEYRDELGL